MANSLAHLASFSTLNGSEESQSRVLAFEAEAEDNRHARKLQIARNRVKKYRELMKKKPNDPTVMKKFVEASQTLTDLKDSAPRGQS